MKIYLDTSVISALFDKRTPERKIQTEQAWELLAEYEIFISNIVVEELSNAKDDYKEEFLKAVEKFAILEVTDDIYKLANEYVARGIFPEKYIDDAVHVAVASLNNIGILLSWNFTHLVKMKTRRMVALVNSEKNIISVEIISPPEL